LLENDSVLDMRVREEAADEAREKAHIRGGVSLWVYLWASGRRQRRGLPAGLKLKQHGE
jgi:hypothetical protein